MDGRQFEKKGSYVLSSLQTEQGMSPGKHVGVDGITVLIKISDG